MKKHLREMPIEHASWRSLLVTASLCISGILLATSVSAENITGFDETSTQQHRQLEAQFDQRINAAEQDVWLRKFSQKPHHVGSAAGKAIAEEVAELME